MNINELTIGQAKELAAMFGNQTQTTSSIAQHAVGKKVIVRSRNEGVNFGEVVMADETGIVLKNVRRLFWMEKAADGGCWYEAISKEGLGKGSKVSTKVPEKIIIENYSVTVCNAIAIASIEGWADHEG